MRKRRPVWRECGYCSGRVRKAYCSPTCTYHAQGLRYAEKGLRPRDSARTSDWEDAAKQARVTHAARLLGFGCPADVAVDEAGFMLGEREAAYQALKRRGLSWPNSREEWSA